MRDLHRYKPLYLVVVVLVALVLSVYGQTGAHPFINIDDGLYVFENPVVLRGITLDGVSWAFTTFHAGNWHPLTWVSHMLDVEIFGPAAGWHHRMNVLYHLLNTELLFFVLWRMTGGLWQSAFVAALFGVHPLHVESVAWIAERKNVLSTLFWILTMGAYLRYVRRPDVRRYLLLMVVFALGLMCKPMLVTLPLVLLLLDWWPLQRIVPGSSSFREAGGVFVEKIPLLVLSTASSVITYIAQHQEHAVIPQKFISLGLRVSNAAVSYGAYLWKTLWPVSLSVFYPHYAVLHVPVPGWKIAGSVLLLSGLSALALWKRNCHPYLAVGWAWYLGTMVPVIGVVQVGVQAMADRYTYVPLIGIFIAIAWGASSASRGGHFRQLALGMSGAVLVALAATAWSQVGYWRDNITLFSRALAVTERNWFAWNSLGVSYDRLGQYDQAISCYREALQIMPEYSEALYNLGKSHTELGQHQRAIGYYREALRIKPDYTEAWNNLGMSFSRLGQHQQAVAYYLEALRITPGHANAWNNLGMSFDELGQYQQAIGYYREALRINPDHANAWNNLGTAYYNLGQYQQAVAYYREALRVRPDTAEVWNNLGLGVAMLGQPQQAIRYFQEALRNKPDYAEARTNLLAVSRKLGQSP